MKKTNLKLILLITLMAFGFAANAQNERNLKQEEANKKMVAVFYQKLFGDLDLSVIDQYIVPDYIQHNPDAKDGRLALKTILAKWFKTRKKGKIDIQHIGADGDFVYLHLKNKLPNGGLESNIDIFRIKNNKIVEHWDVAQAVPQHAVNPHPMF